jgi:hypothetical protein
MTIKTSEHLRVDGSNEGTYPVVAGTRSQSLTLSYPPGTTTQWAWFNVSFTGDCADQHLITDARIQFPIVQGTRPSHSHFHPLSLFILCFGHRVNMFVLK